MGSTEFPVLSGCGKMVSISMFPLLLRCPLQCPLARGSRILLEFLSSESVAVTGLTISLAPRMKYIGQKKISETHNSFVPWVLRALVSLSFIPTFQILPTVILYIMYRVFSYT